MMVERGKVYTSRVTGAASGSRGHFVLRTPIDQGLTVIPGSNTG